MANDHKDEGQLGDIPASAIADALRSVSKADEGVEEASGPGNADEAGKLRALLDESMDRARQTQERLKEAHERYLRVAADFENWKKRSAREKEDTIRFGLERVVKDLLPVADNLERAVNASSADAEALLQGVQLVLRQFLDVLAKNGAVPFESVGEPFDPARHEALMQQESDSVPPQTVLSEMAKGYMLHDRLVRPAAVVVSKSPAVSVAPDEAADTSGPGAPDAG